MLHIERARKPAKAVICKPQQQSAWPRCEAHAKPEMLKGGNAGTVHMHNLKGHTHQSIACEMPQAIGTVLVVVVFLHT